MILLFLSIMFSVFSNIFSFSQTEYCGQWLLQLFVIFINYLSFDAI